MITAKYLIVGNWKLNLNLHEASILVHKLDTSVRNHRDVEVVLAPSFIHLQPLSLQIDRRKFKLGAQDAFYKDEGAFTGQVSFSQLHGLVHYAIVGHSERRLYFNETLEIVRDKVAAAIRNDIIPILCIGETQQERRDGETRQVLHDQIVSALSNLTSDEIERVVIAYEPVWAISTFGGELAKPDEVKEAIDFIRHQISALYGTVAAQAVRVLYGGSVNDQDAKSYLEVAGVNGALVGGASIKYHKFAAIINTAHALAREEHESVA